MAESAPTPRPGGAAAKTRQQLIAIAVLLGVIILILASFLFFILSRKGEGTSAQSGAQAADNAAVQRIKKVVSVYETVLSAPNPSVRENEYSLEPLEVGSDISYALINMDDDCVPELLVNYGPQPPVYEISAIGIFGADDNGEMIDFGKIYFDGAATSGGARFSVQQAADVGLIYNTGSRAGTQTVKITREGNELVENPDSSTGSEIAWTPASDTQQLAGIELTPECTSGGANPQVRAGGPNPTMGNGDSGGAGTDSGQTGDSSGDTAAASDESGTGLNKVYEFSGVVRVFETQDEAAEFQGVRNWNPGGQDYMPTTVLILDKETTITLRNGGNSAKYDPTPRKITMLVLPNGYASDGQRLNLKIKAGEIVSSSDTSLPLGAPGYHPGLGS